MNASRSEPIGPPEGLGPIFLLVVLLGMVVWLRREPFPPAGERAVPPPAADLQTEGWSGGLDLGQGARLEARLVSLHGEDRRQAFDRVALARRLGLDSGEPWLLELVYEPGPGGEVPNLSLGSLGLASGDLHLLPLVPMAPVPPEGGVVDPLLSLLALPEELLAGTRLNAVVWGGQPGPSAILTLGPHRLSMHAGTLSAGSIARTLARLDRSTSR